MSPLAPVKKPLFPFFKKKEKPLPKNHLPKMRTKTLPGPQSLKLAEQLKRFECPQITYAGEGYPVFLSHGSGINLTDVDGNRFIDLTACFGVAGLGHAPAPVIEAARKQSLKMVHGLGDVHPNEIKVRLAERLAEITPGNLNQSIFSTTGAEAVETALKTAVMHTKKTGVIAFDGAYHGLTLGALAVTHREDFRKPFQKLLGKHVYFAPFPDTRLYQNQAAEVSMKAVEKIVKGAKRSQHPVGAVLIEPIQGRGGVRTAPADFLKRLREFCDKNAILLIADEIFTGFGRTGTMFALEKSGVVPDLLCVGKALGAGYPISACMGSARVMFSWGASTGEAIHTSTFLGHPLACAAALASLDEIKERKFVDRARQMGEVFRRELHRIKTSQALIGDVRGAGLMIGVELNEPINPTYVPTGKKPRKPQAPLPASAKARAFVGEAMRQGILMLSSGPGHNVLQITPPFQISEKEILHCAGAFDRIFKKIGQ